MNKELYYKTREENKEYFVDIKKNKVYAPLDGELLTNFIMRVLTKIKYEAMNNDIEYIIAKAISNPFRDYALLSFNIDGRDDLSEAIYKYKMVVKELSDSLVGGE